MAASIRLVCPSVVRSMINVSVSSLRCNSKAASRTYLVSCFNLKKSFDQNKLHDAVAVGKGKRNDILKECGLRSYSVAAKLTIDEISDKVMSVCKTFDKIPAEKVTMESHFMTDLGLDSLDHVELIMNVEEEFNLEIPDADAEKLLRPKDIVAYVQTREESTT